ncbi:HPr family phosphocarrier protein [Paracoccus sp. (in: a-proteobacteria)]|uniref:HPr family phosphocarrier protein n=1 Tax=Paracoccus sp. TaxID=267 RepID=UPI0028A2C19E|nr:HPr family phosphocarrier protein [Paracoccus sp. (in: a-proteobacteria)]
MTEPVTQSLKIINEKGLHARASAKFVETVERFDARVTVEKDGLEVSGDSIMGLLMLAAPRGSTIHVTARGPQAGELSQALASLVGDYFGEGM